MSREGLIPQLQVHGIQVSVLKYSQASVSVYQGTWKTYAAAIKVLALAHGADSTQLESECRTLISLSHEHILRLYDCFWEQKETNYYFVIVTEWCEKDLAKDMNQRVENHFPWKEEELWKLTIEIVSALTYMQEQGLSHRDIKPENIFMTSTKSVKLGDFGSARIFLSDINSATLTGTPYYLSPKLREAYVNRNPKVVHNSFKSDAYSLGLTLLSLSLLTPPMSLAKTNLSDEEVRAVINTVRFSDLFKSMLTWMLSVSEEPRCDFKELNRWLEEKDQRPREPGPLKATDGYSQYIISSQTRSVSKPKGKLVCMQCRIEVDLFSATAQCEVVQLYCQPSEHMFCSIECCKTFLSNGRFNCPQCGAEIPDETVDWCVPGLSRLAVPKASEEVQNLIEKKNPTSLSNPTAIEETKESVMTSQIAEVPKQKSEPLCMQCAMTVDRYGKDAECQVIQLYCEPDKHMFCTRECFTAYLSRGQLRCPQCKVDIPTETVDFYQIESMHQQVAAPDLDDSEGDRIEKVNVKPQTKKPIGQTDAKAPSGATVSQIKADTGKRPGSFNEDDKKEPVASQYHPLPGTLASETKPVAVPAKKSGATAEEVKQRPDQPQFKASPATTANTKPVPPQNPGKRKDSSRAHIDDEVPANICGLRCNCW